ncbi:hypothetical protein BC629DRAFT_951439 [Irpex lacteus]|nr:hypothetical protein BC629DRAFT_951439 [Irpex lacteus]
MRRGIYGANWQAKQHRNFDHGKRNNRSQWEEPEVPVVATTPTDEQPQAGATGIGHVTGQAAPTTTTQAAGATGPAQPNVQHPQVQQAAAAQVPAPVAPITANVAPQGPQAAPQQGQATVALPTTAVVPAQAAPATVATAIPPVGQAQAVAAVAQPTPATATATAPVAPAETRANARRTRDLPRRRRIQVTTSGVASTAVPGPSTSGTQKQKMTQEEAGTTTPASGSSSKTTVNLNNLTTTPKRGTFEKAQLAASEARSDEAGQSDAEAAGITSDLASAYSPEKTPASTGKAKQPEAIPNQPLTCISPAKTLYIPDAPSTNTVTEDDATVIAPVDAASSRTTVQRRSARLADKRTETASEAPKNAMASSSRSRRNNRRSNPARASNSAAVTAKSKQTGSRASSSKGKGKRVAEDDSEDEYEMQAKRFHLDSDSDEEEGSVFSAPARDARSQSTGTELSVWTPLNVDANDFAVDHQDVSVRLREELEFLDAQKAAGYGEKEKASEEDLGPWPPYYEIAAFDPESA